MSDTQSPPANPTDFLDPHQARAWVERTIVQRPWRPRFFETFAAELKGLGDGPLSVLEIGSGPGHLAAHLLKSPAITRYGALDFSAAMHEMARAETADDPRVDYLTRDFILPTWSDGLGPYDAIVTMQSIHEVRHRDRTPALVNQAAALLRAGGLFLYADHYIDSGRDLNPVLYLKRAEQAQVLKDAGLRDVRLVRDEETMTIHSAVAP